jgi:hypothetical protein
MEAIGAVTLVGSVIQFVDLAFSIVRSLKSTASTFKFFVTFYGPAGVMLWCFGSRDVWYMQMQVLYSTSDADATNFKKSVQEESNIIAVAVSKLWKTYPKHIS